VFQSCRPVVGSCAVTAQRGICPAIHTAPPIRTRRPSPGVSSNGSGRPARGRSGTARVERPPWFPRRASSSTDAERHDRQRHRRARRRHRPVRNSRTQPSTENAAEDRRSRHPPGVVPRRRASRPSRRRPFPPSG
jgi:hypothetical protein